MPFIENVEPYDNSQASVYCMSDKPIPPGTVVKTGALNEGVKRVQKTIAGVKYGKAFQMRNPRQTIQTAISRLAYGKPRKNGQQWLAFSNLMNFQNRFKSLFKEELDISAPQETLNVTLVAVYKKYAATGQLKLIDDTLAPTQVYIREFLKDIEKIRGLEGAYKNKVGQPIKAWMKELNGAFCTFFRACEKIFIDNLKPEFIYANGLNDDELQERMNAIHDWTDTAESDFQEFDESQSEFTQGLEKSVLDMFLRSDALKLYYEIRKAVRVTSSVHNGVNKAVKTSGEPATLFLNTVISFAIAVCMTDLKKLRGLVVKGDDILYFIDKLDDKTFTVQVCLEILGLPPKMLSNPVASFCGGLYAGGVYHYDYVRTAEKMISRPYARLQFTAYQESVKDKLKPWFVNPEQVEANMAKHVGCSKEQANLCMQTLHSFTFLPWEEWERCVEYEISM